MCPLKSWWSWDLNPRVLIARCTHSVEFAGPNSSRYWLNALPDPVVLLAQMIEHLRSYLEFWRSIPNGFISQLDMSLSSNYMINIILLECFFVRFTVKRYRWHESHTLEYQINEHKSSTSTTHYNTYM